MSLQTVTIPNIQVQLTVEQLIAAVHQLEPDERARIARSLAKKELDSDLSQLIKELYSAPSIDEITNSEITSEVEAVRKHQS